MAPPTGATIEVNEIGSGKFALVVIFDGQRFECGFYISRVAALTAAKLFVERKDGERIGRRKKPRGKG